MGKFVYFIATISHMHGHVGIVVGMPFYETSMSACEARRGAEQAIIERPELRNQKYGPDSAFTYISSVCTDANLGRPAP